MDSVYNPIQNQMEIAQLYNRSSRFSGTQSFCDKTTADVFECAIQAAEKNRIRKAKLEHRTVTLEHKHRFIQDGCIAVFVRSNIFLFLNLRLSHFCLSLNVKV